VRLLRHVASDFDAGRCHGSGAGQPECALDQAAGAVLEAPVAGDCERAVVRVRQPSRAAGASACRVRGPWPARHLLTASRRIAGSLRARCQARWKYGVQLLHWQYAEGLLDSDELLGWLATEFRCGTPVTGRHPSSIVNMPSRNLWIFHVATSPCSATPAELLPVILPLVLDLLQPLLQTPTTARCGWNRVTSRTSQNARPDGPCRAVPSGLHPGRSSPR